MKFLFSIIISVGFQLFLSGQCPDKNFLWHRIIYLRDSTKISANEQQTELLQYLNKIKDCPYKNDSTHALLLQRIGWLYSLQKDYMTAIQFTRQSLDMIYKNLSRPSVNYGHVVKSYNNLRILYDSIGEYKLSRQALDSCVSIALKVYKADPHYLLPIKTYNLLLSGDYYECIEFANMGELIAKTDQAYSYYLPYYLIWKTNALIFLNKFKDAEQLLKKTIDDFSKSGNKSFLGTFYGLLARLSEEKKDEKNSLLYVKKSVSINEEAKQLTVCAQAINNLGYDLYFKGLKKYDLALSYYYKALKYADASEALNIYENIANVYVQKRLFDSAFFFFQKGFDQIKAGIDESTLLREAEKYVIDNIEYVEYITNLVLDKADAYLEFYRSNKDQKNLNKAIISYKIIDRLFDKIKEFQSDIQSRLYWRNQIHRLYEHAIEACYLQNNSTDVFYFFEKSRAVLLNDQLNEQRWSAEIDILKQSQFKKQILAKETELNGADKNSAHYAELQRDIFNNKQELSNLQYKIKEKNPLYSQYILDSNFISIPDVRKNILKDHQALIEIFSGDSAVYLLAITMQHIFLEKIDKNAFDKLSNYYISFISQPGVLNRNFNSFEDVSNGLYQLIFQNISLPPGRIIISPDGKYFPFEALVISRQPLTYFLEDYAVSYTYSARYLLNDFKENSVNSNGFMGVAPVQFTNGLPQLSGSDQSIQKMQDYFSNTASFVGNKATRNNFLNEFYKYKVIQLYTHATDSGYTGEPMIYFSDSALALSDLLPEKKPATVLIVLSACQTASGKLYNGEGVFSFNRQFAALGIPSSVSNLWQVDNQSTYRLTELFYKYVSDGMPLDLALQKAKVEFIKTTTLDENKLPYYWAASILVGKTDAISRQKKFEWKWMAAIASLIVLIFIGWGIRRKQILKIST